MNLDVLIPTYRRSAALAVTLTSLALQDARPFRIVVSDQDDAHDVADAPELRAVLRFAELREHVIELHKHVPRRGMAEHRQFLLDQARAPYALFLDDDVLLEPDVVARMLWAMRTARCGFVGCPLIGLSFLHDVREHEQVVDFWDGPVEPEEVRPGTGAWDRHRLHNAANALHVQRRLGITAEHPRLYRVAWVGGCVLYDAEKLRAAGGFDFWPRLPEEHAGEDVLAQLRVMARFGGCGVLPSGAYHQELTTTIENRAFDAPRLLL